MDSATIFEELESQAEMLIDNCKTLKQENAQLRQTNHQLVHERNTLKQKNHQVVNKITRIINQLKNVAEVDSHER